jgi:alpha-ketoglutaric semialdehyde dehydrogenase
MFGNLIGGQWTTSQTSRENRNPSNLSDVIGRYSQASASDAESAVQAARTAFESWQFSGVQERFDILDRVGDVILKRRAEIGDLLAREEGKSLPEAIGEAGRAGAIFKFFAGEALRNAGEILPSVRAGAKVEVTREPVGVVAAITPWNFPIAIPAWKIAPALAYGNCVVLKPAEDAPGCAWLLAEILHEAGVPPGVFNLVMGPGSEIGPVLARGSDAVSFTGSTAVGASVREIASAAGARVQLEMGGKNPLVVLDDADLNTAVQCALQGSFYSTGQRCTASSRIIVTQGIHAKFVTALASAVDALRVGDARDPTTQIGPLASRAQYDKTLHHIDLAKREGATLVAGGAAVGNPEQGYFVQPTLFDRTSADMTLNVEEIFGPVAGITVAQDFEEALAIANSTEFGLTAGICTTSLRYAETFKRRARAGMTMVNLPTAGVDYHVPFGGTKASSYGPREQGAHAREFFTVVKTSYQAA